MHRLVHGLREAISMVHEQLWHQKDFLSVFISGGEYGGSPIFIYMLMLSSWEEGWR